MDLKELKGLGPKTILKLNNNDIYTVNDLINFFPKSYIIYEENMDDFLSCNNTTIKGVLLSNPFILNYRKGVKAVIFYINYNNQKLKCLYFGSDYLKYKIKIGSLIHIYGKYDKRYNEFHAAKVFVDELKENIEVSYKLKDVYDYVIKNAINNLFLMNVKIKETLPQELIDKYKLLDINKYIYLSHNPKNKEDIKQILRRRKYEEFFWYSIRLERLRFERNIFKKSRIIDDKTIIDFKSKLPFTLTKGQNDAINDVINDIKSNIPMNRLIEGDVGSGKTIVGVIASLLEIMAGYQVMVMVPLEVLANQEYEIYKNLFSYLNIKVELLTSNVTKGRSGILKDFKNGIIDVLIGTHSLLSDEIQSKNLGLIIIDEQHKFGVNQREKIKKKYKNLDALYLTATPIPRTLGLTTFGDLDISIINEKPQDRLKITTKIIPYNKINGLFKSVNNEINLNHQIYAVTPYIEDGSDAISIKEAYDMISQALPNARIAMLHGKMKNAEKTKIMQDFKDHQIDILVSTTVIEVGVDSKDATLIMIFDAERYGLAQIHQLRGRVGRSNIQSYCALISDDIDNIRLNKLVELSDGFEIANEDFIERGPGDFLGTNQSGFENLKYASFESDMNIWSCAKKDGENYFYKYKNNELNSDIFDEIISIKDQGSLN
jgi:ATP-dependent DNA helicase RecG